MNILIHSYKRVMALSTIGLGLMIAATGCKAKDNNTMIEDIGITPIVTIETQHTPTPTPLAMTPAPGVTTQPSPEPTVEPTKEPVLLTQQEAEQFLRNVIDTQKYTFELIDDNLNIDGKYYYRYVIMENDTTMEPSILVEKITGILSCYDEDGNVTNFTKFPLDNVEIVDSGDSEITVDSALALLKKLPADKLGLVNNLSHYTIIADDWTTVVPGGDICYCFNVFEGNADDQLVGMYYVSTSGKNIYTINDDLGEIVKIN